MQLVVESRPTIEYPVLCLDNGKISIILAVFESLEAVQMFKAAQNHIFMSGHAMGRSGI